VEQQKLQGLLLQSTSYLGSKKILKVLTPLGLFSLITVKKIQPVLTTPFVFGEWVIKNHGKDLGQLVEASLIEDFPLLKTNLKTIFAAGQIASDLLRTQYPGKNAEGALTLSLACLRQLPLFTYPDNLLSLFKMRLLKLEGLLDETNPFEILIHIRSFKELAAWDENKILYQEVQTYFEEKLSF
jgi:recombinational DNA repair protein (RecF pathway)